MLSAAPTPPPPPPPVRTDTRLVEPDEQWKADLRKRIEHGLRHMVEGAQLTREAILNSRPSESSRERALREYDESMNTIKMLAQDEFNRELRREMSERKWALDVVDSNSTDVARQQQWILDNIRKADEQNTSIASGDAPQNTDGVLSTSLQQQGDSERGTDGSSEGGYGSAGLEETSNLGNHVHRHVRTLLLLSPFTQDPPSLEEMPPRARDGHQISNLRKILRTKMGLTRLGIITPLADARASHIPLVHLAARVPAPRRRYGAPSPAPRSLLV